MNPRVVARRLMRITVVLLVLSMLSGTAFYLVCHSFSKKTGCTEEHVTLLKAIYFGLQTVTTVGYGSDLRMNSSASQWVAIGSLVFAPGVFSLAVARILDAMKKKDAN